MKKYGVGPDIRALVGNSGTGGMVTRDTLHLLLIRRKNSALDDTVPILNPAETLVVVACALVLAPPLHRDFWLNLARKVKNDDFYRCFADNRVMSCIKDQADQALSGLAQSLKHHKALKRDEFIET